MLFTPDRHEKGIAGKRMINGRKNEVNQRSEETLRLSHRALDMKRLDVLPLKWDYKLANHTVKQSRTCFLSKEMRKLMLSIAFCTIWSSSMLTWPMATPRQSTFLSWNLIVERTSLTFRDRSSPWDTGVGNLPAFERPGPRRLGECQCDVVVARAWLCNA